MQDTVKRTKVIETATGELFRCGEFITVVHGRGINKTEFTGRLDYVDDDYIYLDMSTAYHANNRQFKYEFIENIVRAEPPADCGKGDI